MSPTDISNHDHIIKGYQATEAYRSPSPRVLANIQKKGIETAKGGQFRVVVASGELDCPAIAAYISESNMHIEVLEQYYVLVKGIQEAPVKIIELENECFELDDQIKKLEAELPLAADSDERYRLQAKLKKLNEEKQEKDRYQTEYHVNIEKGKATLKEEIDAIVASRNHRIYHFLIGVQTFLKDQYPTFDLEAVLKKYGARNS